MKAWRHTHEYVPVSETETEVRDHIEHTHPSGLRGVGTRLLFSPLALKMLFAFRAWATRRAVEKKG